MINDLRDFDDIDSKLFGKRIYVTNIGKFDLYKTESDQSVKYGLYLDKILISYIWFTRFMGGLMTYEFHTWDSFKNKGIGYEMYKFVMTGEKHRIITDHLCTKSGHRIWQKLIDDPDIETGMINTTTGDIYPIDDSLFANDQYHMTAKEK
jgi:hypothetical protein